MRTGKIKIPFIVICLVSAIAACGCKKQGPSNSASDANENVVIAYYFHKTIRCAGCLEIERNAQRVIETSFANQIADKKLIWAPFNIDDEGGEAFAKEFEVSSSTLVLSKEKNGKHVKYKKLEDAWKTIHESEVFDAYIKDEVQKFLNE